METGAVISILSGVIATLAGALVWLVKSERKERKATIEACTNMLNACVQSLNADADLKKEVIRLLSNWRGH